MKPERDAGEEYFEYDAEEFLVSLTLLITEGRTPECSVKGRTEGLHCPPAQTAQPAHNRHDCSDKLPQCRQARKTRSEVMLLWRNNIPVMIEVMLLPDCCYSDGGPTTDGNDLNDPAIKQDALLLERWTMHPVPRQSGDRFIEEKTLLLAVRSYVFFSQLSAWLSASHGIVPRNILYRISAADEELVWHFSQPPTEHAFPVPNISQSVALKVRVQSLPRQPNYPVLKCSIHTSLNFYEKRGRDRDRKPPQRCDIKDASQLHSRGSSPFARPTHSQHGVGGSRISQCPEVLPPNKPAKWLHPTLTRAPNTQPSEGHMMSANGTEASKVLAPEMPVRSFKSLSLVDHLTTPSPSLRPQVGETNPLIGSLLQERQEVIARIAQHLNYCAPSTPHIPDSLFGSMPIQSPKSSWVPPTEDVLLKKAKETHCTSYNSTHPEHVHDVKSGPSASDTPLRRPYVTGKSDSESRLSPKLATCRKLVLPDPTENSRISDVVQDISRLIQDTFQQSQSRCSKLMQGAHVNYNGVLKSAEQNKEPYSQQNLQGRSEAPSPDQASANGTDSNICTDSRCGRLKVTDSTCQRHSHEHQSTALAKLEETLFRPELKASDSLQNTRKSSCGSSGALGRPRRHEEPAQQGGSRLARDISPKSVAGPIGVDLQVRSQPQDENVDPSVGGSPTGTVHRTPAKECLQNGDVLRTSTQFTLRAHNLWKRQNRHSIDGTAFHPCTGLPLLSSPVPQRKSQNGCFDLDTSLLRYNGLPLAANRRACRKREAGQDEGEQQQLSTSAPSGSLSLLGNFEECVLNYRLEPLGTVEGFTAEVGASGTFCPSHMTLPVEVSFYSVSDDNAPSPYMGVINLESLGKRGYRVPPSGTIQVTLFNPNKTVVKMFVVIYDLRQMPAGHQTFLRQRTFSVPVRREANGSKKPLPLSQERTLRYLIHLRFQSSKSGKIYLHRDIRLLFSRKSMEVDSGAAYELKSFTESPADPPFSPRC
ncbi:atos homolog protein A [Paramormyrops kingsleyae]|uniref:atos homolog protein A n=1 Tax=Paramormyrops kingsleyae TaxID=1676925 RepID=UPI003B96A7D0